MVVIHDHPATAAAQTLLSQEKRILRDAADQAWQQPVRRKTEYANLQAVRAAQSSGRQNLERFERALRFLFDECGVRLGYLQLKFLHAARTVLLKRMFGTGIVSEQSYLQAKFQIKRLYDTCSIIFPRRSGKTTVQTILAAVLAVSQPDGNYVAFNLTGRQSKAWLNQSIKWMELFQKSPEFRYVELQRDMRESLMIRNCCGTTARIASFAGAHFFLSIPCHLLLLLLFHIVNLVVIRRVTNGRRLSLQRRQIWALRGPSRRHGCRGGERSSAT